MRRTALRAIESAKPLARAPRAVSRSFSTANDVAKVIPPYWALYIPTVTNFVLFSLGPR